jgi:hypothetical protein
MDGSRKKEETNKQRNNTERKDEECIKIKRENY